MTLPKRDLLTRTDALVGKEGPPPPVAPGRPTLNRRWVTALPICAPKAGLPMPHPPAWRQAAPGACGLGSCAKSMESRSGSGGNSAGSVNLWPPWYSSRSRAARGRSSPGRALDQPPAKSPNLRGGSVILKLLRPWLTTSRELLLPPSKLLASEM